MHLIDETIRLMGQPLHGNDMRALLDAWGIAYPRKDTVSLQNSSIIAKDAGKTVSLAFVMDAENRLHPPLCGSRKNSYVPILSELAFLQGRDELLPLGFRHGDRRDDLMARYGPPHSASKTRNAHGQPHMEYWQTPVDPARDIEYFVRWWNQGSKGESSLRLHIVGRHPVAFLHDFNEPREATAAHQHPFVMLGLFVEWAIRQGWMAARQQPQDQHAAHQVRTGAMSGADYLRHHWPDCRLWAEDFIAERTFAAHYLENMPPLYQHLSKDYLAQLDVLYGPVPRGQEGARADTVADSPALREAMFALFAQRLAEHRACKAEDQERTTP